MKKYVFDGHMTIEEVVEVSATPCPVEIAPALNHLLDQWDTQAHRIAAKVPVYGRSTGVGANRLTAATTDTQTHGLNLVRSHAVNAGSPVSDRTVRAMLAVRLNQILQGGSGINPQVPRMIAAMLTAHALPEVRRYGGIGTGDLSALAGTALAMVGERELSAPLERLSSIGADSAVISADSTVIGADSALPLMSSSALTIADAALLTDRLTHLLRAQEQIFLVSAAAALANPSSFSADAAQAVPTESALAIAHRLQEIRGESTWQPDRIQDPYAYRAFLVTHAVLVDALARLRDVTERLINIAQESPLFMGNPERVVHHGAFHQAALAHELDAGAIALAQCAPILISRVKLMNDDTLTGLPRFLAPEGGGRSGTMIVEYVAASAMGDVLAAASPSSIHSTVLSCGVEDDASFAPTALHQLEGAASAYEVMLGCELLVSVRALRLRPPGTVILDGPLKDILSQLDALPAIMDDHDLREELDLAQALVRELGV